MLGYEPDDVGSIPPLTTISQELHVTASQLFTMPAVPRDAVAPILNTPYSILSYATFAQELRSDLHLCTVSLPPLSTCQLVNLPASCCPANRPTDQPIN